MPANFMLLISLGNPMVIVMREAKGKELFEEYAAATAAAFRVNHARRRI